MKNAGFTLVEVMTALAILGFAVAGAASAFGSFTRRFDERARETRGHASASLALSHLERDLRSAVVDADNTETGLIGRPDGHLQLTRTSSGDPDSIVTVHYSLRKNDDAWHWWKRTGDQERRLCGPLQNMTVRYFDGTGWKNSWGWDPGSEQPSSGMRGLPVLVRVELTMTEAHPVSRTIPLMVAAFNRSSHE